VIHEVLRVGPFQCNCHILGDESTREAVIIDPGDEAGEILERAKGLKVTALLHTHCHLDHITGTKRVKEETGAPILIHQADRELYEHLAGQYEKTLRLFGLDLGPGHDPLPADRFLKDGEKIRFGRHEIGVLHTPGHTQGSCCFHLGGDLFSGDTLFRRSIGRTDLPGGDLDQEIDSIRSKLYVLDPETVVHPGHGPPTHIEEEKEANPFAPA
jgi:glyoxylase-like metal-dependent hydrolase (beta-lactamase superfamily II)